MIHEYYEKNIVPNIKPKLATLSQEEKNIFSDKTLLITENSKLWPVSGQIIIVKVHEKDIIREMSEFFKKIFSFQKISGMPIVIKCSVDFCGTWESVFHDRGEDQLVRFPSLPTSFLKNQAIYDDKTASQFIEKWESYDYSDILEFWHQEHGFATNSGSGSSHFIPSRIISTHVYLRIGNMLYF